nr:MAG: methylase [Thermoproteus sp. AZ2]
MAGYSKKRLASLVDSLPGFKEPKLRLEQYATPGDIAATIAWTMYMRGELNEGWVVDLGCGTGRLAYAASLLGARALCVDIDPAPLAIPASLSIDVAQCDAGMPCVKRGVKVVMNPPFGIWTRRGDSLFIRGAAAVAGVIYSIHKYAALQYILRLAEGLGLRAELLDAARIDIPPMYPHHRKRRHSVAVAIIRLEATSRGTPNRSE